MKVSPDILYKQAIFAKLVYKAIPPNQENNKEMKVLPDLNVQINTLPKIREKITNRISHI